MPPKRGRPKAQNNVVVDPDDEEALEEEIAAAGPVFKLTDEDLNELQKIDIDNFPIPERYGAAYNKDGNERLVINKMVLENFKSYYGRHCVGPFHSHFSAIIGANGSGKSNIIDALMFVFGFKAKKIRSDKVQNLIHKSYTHADVPHAAVRIHFVTVRDEDGKSTILKDTEFTVERVVKKNGQSKFVFDKQSVNKEELIRRLRDKGIDMDHNRFLILQGEVEQISLMKPKARNENEEGLLEYLDDIIGTSRLKPMVNELDSKLTAALNAKQEQINKIRQVEEKKNELIDPVRDMVVVLQLDNQIAVTQHAIFSRQIYFANKKLAELDKKVIFVTAMKRKKAEKLDEMLEDVHNAKKTMASKEKEVEDMKKSFQGQKEALEKKRLYVQAEEKHIKKLEKDLKAQQKTQQKSLQQIEEYKDKPEEFEVRKIELEEELADARVKREQARPEYEEKSKEAREMSVEIKAKMDSYGAKLAAAKTEVANIDGKLVLAENQKVKMGENLDKLKARYEETLADYEASKNQVEEASSTRDSSLEKLSQLEPQLEVLRAEKTQLQDEERKAVSKFENLSNQLNSASAEQHKKKEKNFSIKTIMDEKRNGNIPGIFGRLGDLGMIEPKYDYAASFANGFDQILCDSQETVKQVLKVIQEKRLSRTQLLALSNIPDNRDKMRPMETPGNLPRLFDLIKPKKPEFAKAFYQVLGNMLVCDKGVDTAHEITRAPFRGVRFSVVTTKGEIIHGSGHMTGGGGKTFEKRGNLMLTTERVTEETVDLDQLRNSVNNAKNVLVNVRQRLSLVESKLRSMEALLVKEKELLKSVERKANEVKLKMKNLERNIGTCKAELDAENRNVGKERREELDQKIEALKREKDESTEVMQDILKTYEECNSQLEEVYSKVCGSAKTIFDKFEAIVKKNEKELVDLKAESTKVNNEMKKLQRNLEPTSKQIGVLTDDIKDIREKLEEAKAQVAEAEPAVLEQEEKLDNLQSAVQAELTKISKTDVEEVKLKKELKELHDEEIAAKAKVDHQKNKIQTLSKSVESLKLHDIKEFCSDDSLKKKKKPKRRRKSADYDSENEELDDEKGDESFEDNMIEKNPTEDDGEAEDENESVFKHYEDDELEEMDADILENKLEDFKVNKRSKKVVVRMDILDDYRKRMVDYKEQCSYLKKIDLAFDKIQAVYDKFNTQRRNEFGDALADINAYLQEQYMFLSLGGEARLEPVIVNDFYADGIRFNVRPMSKGWREIGMTSGGEKTLSSLALVFALHQFQPAPFYVMDEIDAALDFKNVKMISKFVQKKTKNSQFIIISLRDNMYQAANRLIGISKVNEMASCTLLNLIKSEKGDEKVKRHNKIMPA